MNSFYKCASGGRTVTVWPTITGEAGFYDTVVVDDADEATATTVTRLTAREAASVVITELGAPLSTTVESLTGMIVRWRDEFDAMAQEPS